MTQQSWAPWMWQDGEDGLEISQWMQWNEGDGMEMSRWTQQDEGVGTAVSVGFWSWLGSFSAAPTTSKGANSCRSLRATYFY